MIADNYDDDTNSCGGSAQWGTAALVPNTTTCNGAGACNFLDYTACTANAACGSNNCVGGASQICCPSGSVNCGGSCLATNCALCPGGNTTLCRATGACVAASNGTQCGTDCGAGYDAWCSSENACCATGATCGSGLCTPNWP
jgi:hypothetical protein